MSGTSQESADWIAVDWGTTNLRVWKMSQSGDVLETTRSDNGMGKLSPNEFEPALLGLISPYLTEKTQTLVLCSGMVGARQGWKEADYLSTPCKPPEGSRATPVETEDHRISVRILPGIKQVSPSDVMRGEETQIAGVLSQDPQFDGVICLPGTHTKWVHISAEEIVSFQTYMTGEIFELLSRNSVLKHSVTADDWDQDAFLAAISDAIARPQSVAAHLFGLRAGSLVSDLGAASAKARLSGLLIGLEIAGSRPYWLGQNVAILGSDTLSVRYRDALAEQGVQARLLDGENLTLAGLKSAYAALKEHQK